MTTSWVPVEELVQAFLEHRITDGPLGNAVLAYALRRDRAPRG